MGIAIYHSATLNASTRVRNYESAWCKQELKCVVLLASQMLPGYFSFEVKNK